MGYNLYDKNLKKIKLKATFLKKNYKDCFVGIAKHVFDYLYETFFNSN